MNLPGSEEELLTLVDDRIAGFGLLLHNALRADFARTVEKQIEDRLRARPQLFQSLGMEKVVELRQGIEDAIEELVEAAGGPVLALREKPPGEAALEEESLARALGDVLLPGLGKLLADVGFPPDEGGGHRVSYLPAPLVAWAFREVRRLDAIRAKIVSRALEVDFELRLLLPEIVLLKGE